MKFVLYAGALVAPFVLLIGRNVGRVSRYLDGAHVAENIWVTRARL
jgi:hypothetical protein